jgi:xanthine dehydrogenase accessory factor
MIELWQFALEKVRDGRSPVLVMVVDHEGSVPGTTGAAMVVTERETTGTVGGGIAEHDMIGRARSFSGPPDLMDIEHTAEGSGSLCSGRHTMAVLGLAASDEPVLASIVDTLSAHRPGVLTLSKAGMSFRPGETAPSCLDSAPSGWSFCTALGDLETLTIVGGGHCALALSRVMATLPFRVVVLDDRPELPTMAANSFAHELRVVNYRELARHVPEGDRSWVVVMTFGHANDETALRALAGVDLRYLGLLGSASKVRRMFDRMRADGVAEEHLNRISAPVGLSIGSHTPEEIAISIAAEIIRSKNLPGSSSRS